MADPVFKRERPEEAPPHPEFETIYREHAAFVWRCLNNLGVAPHLLEDGVQETFVIVHRRLADYRAESKLRTWIFGIARHVACNARRSQKRQRAAPWPPDLDPSSSAPSADELIAERESAQFVQTFLRGLGEPDRELFMLAMLEEISLPEVADMLNLKLNTAYSRLRRVRLEFRRALRRRRIVP